ncbi:hypothetical protein DFJ73DRAFT_630662 [Zopfochytrium polystomum]|nr:hypothetical protein DFJ73DRAFT_630662 [Zopfochytrium polystomum]
MAHKFENPFPLFLACAAVLVVSTAVTLAATPELSSARSVFRPLTPAATLKSVFAPLRAIPPFRRVFLARVLMKAGFLGFSTNFFFFCRDCIDVVNQPSPTSEAGYAEIPGVVITALAAFLVPRSKRKIVVFVSAFFCVAGLAFESFTFSFYMAVGATTVFFLGQGPYNTVDYLMATDVMPSAKKSGAFFALWSISSAVPYFTVLPVTEFVLQKLQARGNCLGFKAMNAVYALLIILSAIVTGTIKEIQ